jgi:sugar-specific transcriptional regulator TrmB
MIENKSNLIEVLSEELELTPYESKAYATILTHGSLSPQGVNQKSGIPRPRTYDVLNSVVGKGLLMEQPGRPVVYAAVDPRIGLEKMLTELERKTLDRLEKKRRIFEQLSQSLSKLHDRSRGFAVKEERIWVTRRDSAFVSKYSEAIRSIEKEFVVATTDTAPPEKEILDAVEFVLKKNKCVKIVRQFSSEWSVEDYDRYEKLIELDDQVRYLKYGGLRYGIFDQKAAVLVLPSEEGSQTAVWISLPSLAMILYEHFEELWNRSQPALPILKRLKNKKTRQH